MKIKSNIAISESGFLFDPLTGESYSLNQTGREILELLKMEKSESEIKKTILSSYDIDAPTFERYFIDFISILKTFQILTD